MLTVTIPIAERTIIVGPIISILISIGLIALWSRLGPPFMNGMMNGICGVIVVLFNLVAIVVSLVALLGHIAV
jgi:hypothetical protein